MQIGPAMTTYGAIMFVSIVFPEIFAALFGYLVKAWDREPRSLSNSDLSSLWRENLIPSNNQDEQISVEYVIISTKCFGSSLKRSRGND